jgi:hypothetical protein
MFHRIAFLKLSKLPKKEFDKFISKTSKGSMQKVHAIPATLLEYPFGMAECAEAFYSMIGTDTTFTHTAKGRSSGYM